MSVSTRRRGLPVLAACLLLTSCGGVGGMDHGSTGGGSMRGMYMGDANATPADKVPGAELRTGTFRLLDGRPSGTDSVAGTAWMALSGRGTTVTVELNGLQAGRAYLALVHARACSDDSGGGNFRFDRNGPTMPPNEIHLQFTADPSGHGFMTAENRGKASGAKSVVLSPSDAMDSRVACADL